MAEKFTETKIVTQWKGKCPICETEQIRDYARQADAKCIKCELEEKTRRNEEYKQAILKKLEGFVVVDATLCSDGGIDCLILKKGDAKRYIEIDDDTCAYCSEQHDARLYIS